MKRILLLYLLLIFSSFAHAQKSRYAISLDSISRISNNTPLEKRIRLTILGFGTSDNMYSPITLRIRLIMLLTDAIQESNDFRILENVYSTSQTNSEASYPSNGTYSPQTGRQVGSQIIIKGNVTRLTAERGILKTNVATEFVVDIVDPESRDILFSKTFSVETKVWNPKINNIGPAIDSAIPELCRQGALQVLSFLLSKKDQIKLTDPNLIQHNSTAVVETIVTLDHANFAAFNDIGSILSGSHVTKSMERHFGNNMAAYTVKHSGSSDDLLNDLITKIGDKYEVTGFEHGKISIVAK